MLQLNEANLIQLALALPLIAAMFAAIIPYRNIRDCLILFIAFFLPACVFKIYQFVYAGTGILSWQLFEIVPGVAISFKIEAAGLVFAMLLAVLWVTSLLYSIGYMRSNFEGNQPIFFTYLCIAIFAGLGVAFAGNLLTLFIFYEIITIATYPLVTHNHSEQAKKAGRKYIAYLMGTSLLFFLPAILLTFHATKTLDFTIGGILNDKISLQLTLILLALYVLGIAKTAMMPLHKWLPAAMVAPAPVSALLHAVVVVKAGIFSLLKIIVYIFGVDNLSKIQILTADYGNLLLYFSMFTIISASIIALYKDNLKQLLAYSTISQLAYVIMALAMFSPQAIIAAIFQIVAHAFAKITMFFAAGAIYSVTKTNKISEISGIGRKMPFTVTAFAIAALSIIGLPPMAGFFAKWYIIDAAMQDEQFLVLAVIAISTMLNAAYFLPVIYKAFFGKITAVKPANATVPANLGKFCGANQIISMVFATCFSCAMLILLFIYPQFVTDLAAMVGK